MSKTISRVMCSMVIYLDLTSPSGSSDLPESMDGPPAFLFGLASDGVYRALTVTRQAVVSYTAFPPLPVKLAVYFCCTFLGVASTGRYPASCPVKPGLSSPAAFRHLQPRPSILLTVKTITFFFSFVKSCSFFILQPKTSASNKLTKK